MKKMAGILLLMSSAGLAGAQNSWKVVLHKKILLTSTVVSEERNVKLIKSSDWKKNGYLEVEFKENPPSGWLHSLRFMDEKGNEMLVRDSVTAAKVKIIMMISPPNPMMMAPSRLIHLITLKLP
jgi:hypothetical protein